MFDIDDESSRLLQKAVKEGNAVLLLGAGTSATSLNAQGSKVKLGGSLAQELAEMGGIEYSQDELSDVLGAVVGQKISTTQVIAKRIF